MTTELWYLFLTTVLLTVLWIPYIIGSVQTAGPLTPEEYRIGRNVDFPHWVQARQPRPYQSGRAVRRLRRAGGGRASDRASTMP